VNSALAVLRSRGLFLAVRRYAGQGMQRMVRKSRPTSVTWTAKTRVFGTLWAAARWRTLNVSRFRLIP